MLGDWYRPVVLGIPLVLIGAGVLWGTTLSSDLRGAANHVEKSVKVRSPLSYAVTLTDGFWRRFHLSSEARFNLRSEARFLLSNVSSNEGVLDWSFGHLGSSCKVGGKERGKANKKSFLRFIWTQRSGASKVLGQTSLDTHKYKHTSEKTATFSRMMIPTLVPFIPVPYTSKALLQMSTSNLLYATLKGSFSVSIA